jgi:hypothetical protein
MTFIKQNNPRVYQNLFDEILNTFPTTWGKDVESNWSVVPVNIHENEEGISC